MSTLTEAAEAVAKMKGIPTEEKLREILSTGVLIVTFNKLDGEERVMTCTNNIENIPDNRPSCDCSRGNQKWSYSREDTRFTMELW